MDKTFWQAIVDSDYAIPNGHTITGLIPEFVKLLASTDPDLRDGFGYGILVRWIALDPQFTPEDLHRLRLELIAGITMGIGERNTDTVFFRSFSMLILGLIVYNDINEPFLQKGDIDELFTITLDYFQAEKDLRGYVPDKGWAHAIAHTADMLKFMARHPSSGKDRLQHILDAIFTKLATKGDYVYIHNEDERLALAVLDVLKRDTLSLEALQQWAEKFAAWKRENERTTPDFDPEYHSVHQNIRNFLRSLYCRLDQTDAEEMPKTAIVFKDTVKTTARMFSA